MRFGVTVDWETLSNDSRDERLALMTAFLACIGSAYFGKYLQSRKPCAASAKHLPSAFASDIINHTRHNQKLSEKNSQTQITTKFNRSHPQYGALKILFHILQSFVGRELGLSEELRNQIMVQLQEWRRAVDLMDREAVGQLDNVLALLKPQTSDWASKFNRNIGKGWRTCGLAGCLVTTGLKACSR
jgi:hypothetical protein